MSCNTDDVVGYIETVASAAMEPSALVHEIVRQIKDPTGAADKAVDEVSHTNFRGQVLSEAVNWIGEVVNLLTDIAEQANLLVLNATNEAARAGGAGKGYAALLRW